MYGLKFKLKRLIYRRRRAILKKYPITDTERHVFEICKTMMRNPNSDLFVSPISGDRYISNREKEIDIYIKEDTVEIANHEYQYILTIRDIILKDIKKYHDRVIEGRKRQMEAERGRNINHSLNKILLSV